MGKSRKNKVKKEEKTNNIKKKLIIIFAVIVLVAIIISGIIICQNNKNSEAVDQDVEAIVMYSVNNQASMILEDDNKVLSLVTTISWPEHCKGTVKKDGKMFSENNNTILTESGIYEIIVVTPNKKNKIKRKIEIDRTPPEVTVEQTSKGTYTINFKDINDIDKATLTKYDTHTSNLPEIVDLKENGLKESIEIIENGYYKIECSDKMENVYQKNFLIGELK